MDVGLVLWHHPILVRGPTLPRAGAPTTPTPKVEVYPTPYGDVTQVVVSPKVYETVEALEHHHVGDLYTPDQRILRERAVKARVQA